MTRKISLLLLLVTIFTFAFSMTSCEASDTVINGLVSILPEENSSKVAEFAHDLVDQVEHLLDEIFSFRWAKQAWSWIDSKLGITDKYNQTTHAIELIKTGKFSNILEGLTVIFGCGILLVVLGAIALAVVLIAIIVDVIGGVVLSIIFVLLIIAILILAVLGFVFVLLPMIKK